MESSSTYPEPCTQGQYLTHSQPCLLSKERALLPEAFLPQISLGPILFLGIGACQLSVPQLLHRSPQRESGAVQVGRGDEASSATQLPNTYSAWYPWTCQLGCCLPKSMSQLSTSSTLFGLYKEVCLATPPPRPLHPPPLPPSPSPPSIFHTG